jgi:hypothetical protein
MIDKPRVCKLSVDKPRVDKPNVRKPRVDKLRLNKPRLIRMRVGRPKVGPSLGKIMADKVIALPKNIRLLKNHV